VCSSDLKGFDEVYGARPLKRVIMREIQDPLARLIIEGKVKDSSKIQLSLDNAGVINFF
jgi:ATP-dependent Clp protease ATP-binding subunit ClpB